MLLVMGVGMSMPFTSIRWLGIGILGILAAVFTAAFLLHELAHKFVAQHHGLWAEFRLTKTGALITLFSIFFPIKLISPGAVMVGGFGNIETLGKVSLAGPLANLFLSILFWGIIQTSPSTTLFLIAGYGGFFNALIALYNLIPFGLLDGQKIFRWNKMVWGATFALSIALFGWFLFWIFPLI